MRIWIRHFTLMRIKIRDPAPHQSDANLQPLVYIASRAPFWASMTLMEATTTLHGSIEPLKFLNFYFHAGLDPTFLSNADPASQNKADPDPQP